MRKWISKKAVTLHFSDIGQDPANHDVTYENGQARERTQVLMDIAIVYGGMVIGTGDMSELSLGWATYNGYHNVYVWRQCIGTKDFGASSCQILCGHSGQSDIKGDIAGYSGYTGEPGIDSSGDGQYFTENRRSVGPYELHDFFLYHILRFGRHPAKVYRLALKAFEGVL